MHTRTHQVLLSGDGNDNDGRASYWRVVALALKKNWTVEVWAWRLSVGWRYKDMFSE